MGKRTLLSQKFGDSKRIFACPDITPSPKVVAGYIEEYAKRQKNHKTGLPKKNKKWYLVNLLVSVQATIVTVSIVVV